LIELHRNNLETHSVVNMFRGLLIAGYDISTLPKEDQLFLEYILKNFGKEIDPEPFDWKPIIYDTEPFDWKPIIYDRDFHSIFKRAFPSEESVINKKILKKQEKYNQKRSQKVVSYQLNKNKKYNHLQHKQQNMRKHNFTNKR